jgi:hypothetical protein
LALNLTVGPDTEYAANPIAGRGSSCVPYLRRQGQAFMYISALACGQFFEYSLFSDSLCMQGSPETSKFPNGQCSQDPDGSVRFFKAFCSSSPAPPPPSGFQADDRFCNNGLGCRSQFDTLARCFGSNTSSTTVYTCQCSSAQFLAPLCQNDAAQLISINTQVQQFNGSLLAAQFAIQQESKCRPGLSLCPPRPPPASVQQSNSRDQLITERDSLQRLQSPMLSQYQSLCPIGCSNPSNCLPQCGPGACVNCAALFNSISSLNASISRVLSALISIGGSAPPEPSLIYSDASDTCVLSIIQCFNSTSPSALVVAIKTDVQFCVNGNLKFCPLLGCVSQDTPCIPLSSCPADKPKRCPFLGFQDGSPPCVAAGDDCSSTASTPVLTPCSSDQKPCPGGLHCAAASLSDSSFFRVRLFNLLLLSLPTKIFPSGLHVQFQCHLNLERMPQR